MRLLVLGAGGIGGYFGGRLAAVGNDVSFLVRPRRRAQLDRDGLRIVSPVGDLTMPVVTVAAAELKPVYDVVLLTCKAYDLDSAMDAIAPALRAGSAIVPMLNGMAHVDRLVERFGKDSVMGGTCSISVALEPDGVIRHANLLQRIAFGELDGSTSERSSALATAFGKTSVEWELAPNILLNMWEKISFLSVLAARNCLFRANIGQIARAPGGLDTIERALNANFEILQREGYPPRASAVEFARKTLMNQSSTLRGSMLHDLETGARVEADHIIGWMLEKARTHGVDDTVLSLAYTHLKAYEDRQREP